MWDTLSEGLAQARREMAARERREIPHEEIAGFIGVSAAAYSRWENGKRVPGEGAVIKLAEFFGVTPAYLRYGITHEVPRRAAGKSVAQELAANENAPREEAKGGKKRGK